MAVMASPIWGIVMAPAMVELANVESGIVAIPGGKRGGNERPAY